MFKLKKREIIGFIFVLFIFVLVVDSIGFNNEYGKIMNFYNSVAPQLPGSNAPARLDTFSMMNNYLGDGISRLVLYLYPLLILSLSLINDKKNFKSNIKSGLKSLLLLPCFYGMLFIACAINSHFNFDPSTTYYIYSPVEGMTVLKQLLEVLLNVVNINVLSTAVINVGIIVKKYVSNNTFATLLSFLIVIIYEVMIDMFGPMLGDLCGDNNFLGKLGLFNFWFYIDIITSIKRLIYGVVISIITFLISKKVYTKEVM